MAPHVRYTSYVPAPCGGSIYLSLKVLLSIMWSLNLVVSFTQKIINQAQKPLKSKRYYFLFLPLILVMRFVHDLSLLCLARFPSYHLAT
jgi:hypothetical protein